MLVSVVLYEVVCRFKSSIMMANTRSTVTVLLGNVSVDKLDKGFAVM